MRPSYIAFIQKLLLFGKANGIDDNILDMIGSVLIMHFKETYNYYPEHPLHKRILQLEMIENVNQWSEIINNAFVLENVPFIALQTLKSNGVSIASINEMHINGLNQIHEGNRILQQRVERVETSNNVVFQEMVKYSENYERVESKIDYIIDLINNKNKSNNEECYTGKRPRVENALTCSYQQDMNRYIENTTNIICSEPNTDAQNDEEKTNNISNINQILKPSNMRSLFFIWYGDNKIFKYEPKNADERSNLKKLSKMICYMKRFLPDNTNLNENMSIGTVVRLGDLTETKLMDFIRKNNKDGTKLSKKAVIWNNLKRLESITLKEFPVPRNVIDSVTPKSPQYFNDICNFKES